jgi:hypothetical protein
MMFSSRKISPSARRRANSVCERARSNATLQDFPAKALMHVPRRPDVSEAEGAKSVFFD